MEGGSPTLRRRRLGRALRELRDKARLTGEEAAARVERSASWISRVEAGRVGLRVRDLDDLLDLYRLDEPQRRQELEALARVGKQRGWWSRYSEDIDEAYAIFIGLEADARALLTYEHVVVPGLLQTEDYCRAILRLAAHRPLDRDALETRVMVRMTRQARLREDPPELRFILDEAVLHRAIGGRPILRDQLVHLANVAEMPKVDLRVIPFDHGDYFVSMTSFVIMNFRDDPPVAYLETLIGEAYHDEQEEVALYCKIFDALSEAALSPRRSAAVLHKVVTQLS